MITIRTATEDDLPSILDIYNHIIVNTTAVYHYQPHTMEMRKAWYDGRVKEGLPVFVAEEDGKVVGFSSYGPFRPWPAYKYTMENSVYVADGQRGKGIGRSLMEPLLSHARAKDVHAMIAVIDASNDASVQLHRSFGFEEVGHFRQVGYKFDRWLDLKFMELVLDGPQHPVGG